MNWLDFCTNVEDTIRMSIGNSFPYDWDEDYVTRLILTSLRNNFGNVTINDPDTLLNTSWLPYKLSGSSERKFGDIAIIVNIKFQDGDTLEGVSFLEAKKRVRNSPKFKALRFGQLETIRTTAPHSMLLLYDYENITQFAWPKDYFTNWNNLMLPTIPYTKSVVSQVGTVLRFKRKDTRIYKLSLPFSYQLCLRYLRGFDLEFTQKAIMIAKGFAEERFGRPLYLLTISVAYGKVEPAPIDVNRASYRPLEED